MNPLPRWIEGDSFAPFVGTPGEFLDTVLELAGITEEDVVCDIGSGDGNDDGRGDCCADFPTIDESIDCDDDDEPNGPAI